MSRLEEKFRRRIYSYDREDYAGNGRPPIQDKKGYGREAGILVLVFAAITLVASFCMLLHPFLGIALVLLGLFLTGLQFRRIEEKYSGEKK